MVEGWVEFSSDRVKNESSRTPRAELIKGMCTIITTDMYYVKQDSTVQYTTVQYSAVQYSTVQYSTVQYSTAQYSAVQVAGHNER